jgi:hypothetical protein
MLFPMHVLVLAFKLDKLAGHIVGASVTGMELLHFALKGWVTLLVKSIIHHGCECLVRIEGVCLLLHEDSLGVQVIIGP